MRTKNPAPGKLTRRQALKQTAAASAAAVGFPYIVPASALGKDGTVAPSNRIVMGCIGVGGQGTGNMKQFLRNADVQVVAVCDVDRGLDGGRGRDPAKKIVEDHYAKNKPSGKYKGCDAYGDFRKLVDRKDIDAVSIGTPDHWHALTSIAAAKAGKDIYCEKPLANTIVEGRAICDAVEKNKRILQTGSHERSRDNCRFAAELVRNGRIGKLHTIRVNLPANDGHHQEVLKRNKPEPTMEVPEGFDYDFWLGHTPRVPYTKNRCHFWWRFILNYGGGEMTDRGAHVIDIGQLANNTDDTGPVKFSAKSTLRASGGIYDTFFGYEFECLYANGVRMIGKSEGQRGIKFEGDKGWIFVHIHGGKLAADPASLLKEKIGANEIDLGRSPGHHRNFLDCVKSRQPTVATQEIGQRTATICHLLNIGMIVDKKLDWDPKAERITNNAEANAMLARPMRSPWHL